MKKMLRLNTIMVSLKHYDLICVDWFSCYAFLEQSTINGLVLNSILPSIISSDISLKSIV